MPESSWTGTNTKAGQLMIVKCNAADKGVLIGDISNVMFISLQSENVLEIRDVGCTVFD